VQLHTYLNYGGNCEDAFKFYEHYLGGKITMLMRQGDQPGGQAPAGPGRQGAPRENESGFAVRCSRFAGSRVHGFAVRGPSLLG
jgi:uncharacterized glyoxalase superfamily protein PhnB